MGEWVTRVFAWLLGNAITSGVCIVGFWSCCDEKPTQAPTSGAGAGRAPVVDVTVVSRSSSEEVLRVSGLSREWAGGGCRLVGWGWQMPLAERVPVVGTGASSASACTRGRVHSAVLPVVTLVLLARSSGILLL